MDEVVPHKKRGVFSHTLKIAWWAFFPPKGDDRVDEVHDKIQISRSNRAIRNFCRHERRVLSFQYCACCLVLLSMCTSFPSLDDGQSPLLCRKTFLDGVVIESSSFCLSSGKIRHPPEKKTAHNTARDPSLQARRRPYSQTCHKHGHIHGTLYACCCVISGQKEGRNTEQPNELLLYRQKSADKLIDKSRISSLYSACRYPQGEKHPPFFARALRGDRQQNSRPARISSHCPPPTH